MMSFFNKSKHKKSKIGLLSMRRDAVFKPRCCSPFINIGEVKSEFRQEYDGMFNGFRKEVKFTLDEMRWFIIGLSKDEMEAGDADIIRLHYEGYIDRLVEDLLTSLKALILAQSELEREWARQICAKRKLIKEWGITL